MRGWWTKTWSQFWALPALCCAVALGLGLALPHLDAVLADKVPFIFAGGPEGARALLAAITTAMISVTGVVFSITVVVMQLASSQFSPRVLRSFLDSRLIQVTLGVFAGTFLYAVVVLRAVRGGVETQPFVPQLAVTGAFVLVLASVALFLAYINHITQSIRVSTIIHNVGTQTRGLIERYGADAAAADAREATDVSDMSSRRQDVVGSERHGVVTGIDADALVSAATRADVVLELRVRLGDAVAAGMPFVAVHGDQARLDVDAVRAAVPVGPERTMEQDVAFGFRQLVDIAERALSPAVNDPTTAVQSLDEMHDLLRRLAGESDPHPGCADESGRLRVVLRPWRFGDHLDLAVDEIAHYGRDSVQVPERLADVLGDLCEAARPEHRRCVQAKIAALVEDGTLPKDGAGGDPWQGSQPR